MMNAIASPTAEPTSNIYFIPMIATYSFFSSESMISFCWRNERFEVSKNQHHEQTLTIQHHRSWPTVGSSSSTWIQLHAVPITYLDVRTATRNVRTHSITLKRRHTDSDPINIPVFPEGEEPEIWPLDSSIPYWFVTRTSTQIENSSKL